MIFLLLAILVGLHPIGAAIASVFLFAGPHNWQEARYILGRLPARPGKLWPYMALSVTGWAAISVSSIALSTVNDPGLGYNLWNAGLVAWVAALAWLRSRENPRRTWPWLFPGAVALASVGMWIPMAFSVALVYVHPLTALFIADRELQAHRHPWRQRFRKSLPWVALGLFVTVALTAPWSPGDTDPEGLRGLLSLPGNSLGWLGAHVYLECVHYAVWIVLLPAVAASCGRSLERMPLLRKARWRVSAARIGFALAALGVAGLWWAFRCDPVTTRDAYFTLAVGHVLVEYPFLLRTL
jgi:hypothetical protein